MLQAIENVFTHQLIAPCHLRVG